MNGLNTPVYMHSSFGNLLSLLLALKVFGARRHKISHQLTMIGGGIQHLVKPDWIPLAIIDTSANFIEIVPRKEMEKDEFTT